MPVISANTTTRVEGYFRLEWKLAVDRSHLIAAERAFILPVVIDETRDADALVPDRFREVQWTRCPAGNLPEQFVDRVARLLASDVQPVPAADSPAPAKAPATVRQPAWRRRGLIGTVMVIALLAFGAGVVFKLSSQSAVIAMVAVLPFENATGDPGNEYLSDGISESLITKLSSLGGLHVISRTSSFALKGKKLSPTEIGKLLGVDALILGNVSQHGSNLNVAAELVSVRDATQLWGETYTRPVADVLQAEGEIATAIAQALRRQVTGEEKVKLTHSDTSDPDAYRLYLKGREFMVGSQAEMDKSVDLFQQAVARAPGYSLAHAGLAEVYTRQAYLRASGRTEALGKARTAAIRALELDPNLAEAHTALGDIHWYFDWDWAAAEAEYRRGLALSPGSEAVHESYGAFLYAMGRLDEGLVESREAARLDPLSVDPFHDIAINALLRGDYQQAAAGFRRTIEIDPDWTWGYIKLARTLAIQKRCKEAFVQAEIAERKIAGGAAPLSRSWLGATYATCGDSKRARQKLDELHALEKDQYVDPVSFALIHVALGEMDVALQAFERAYEDRSPNMAYALILPKFNRELIGNARYQALVDRMRFPQQTRQIRSP
jgi:serine/threonine-protein kinase